MTTETETTKAERSSALPHKLEKCPVCRHVQRRAVERAVFLGDQPPRSIAAVVPTLSRRQIQKHMDRCPLLPDVRRKLFERLYRDALRKSEGEGEVIVDG